MNNLKVTVYSQYTSRDRIGQENPVDLVFKILKAQTTEIKPLKKVSKDLLNTVYSRNILSGGSILSTCGAGWFCSGILSMFLGGIPKIGSPPSSILKVPFLKVRIAFTQASLVE
jgi:hypothetical protein